MANTREFDDVFNSIAGMERHRSARFGIALHDVADGRVIVDRDASFIFQAASTTKSATVASALAALGADFRFETVVRYDGAIDDDGVLHGDLILVASGDPNLSARVRPDDTLAFTDLDHVLNLPGTQVVAGDPLFVLRKLVREIAANGITRIAGRVCIDLSIFPEGFREMGTMTVVSPIVINDNVVDVTVHAGSRVGEPVALAISPTTGYVRFVSEAMTSAPGTSATIALSSEKYDEASGQREVRVTGSLPAGTSLLYASPVERPSAFARTLLVELLAEAGIPVDSGIRALCEFQGGDTSLSPRVLASHVSPPFSEAAKVILKVSQNLHAEICPRVVGSVVGGVRGDGAEIAGYRALADFLGANSVTPTGVIQADACGMSSFYSPDFMCRLLRAIAAHPIYDSFKAALPILGRDGTLADIVPESVAAGRVFAKTGTLNVTDRLTEREFVEVKALAGYIESASGKTFAFAIYANNIQLEPDESIAHVGTLLGKIANAMYQII